MREDEKTGADRAFDRLWDNPTGWRRASAVSHRVVGQRFIVTGLVFFLIAGVFALLIRTQLMVPENTFLSSQTYNELFTMHGTVMMFLFAIPILEGFAVYLLPLMLGARDLIFPRLGAFGYWCYLFGGIIVLSSFALDAAPDGGWFMYVPLTTKDFTPGLSADFWLVGVTFAEIASVTAAVEIIAAILCTRAPGMSLSKMPIFAWYMLVTAGMIAVGFPPLIIGSILLETNRALGLPFFDPALGGDPLLWQHLFWIFGHPEVYIIFLPAAGMVSTILPVMVGKPLFGYGYVVAAVVAMGFLSFGLWAHHMFATGLPTVTLALFSSASMTVAIPTGVQIFAMIATLASGRPRMTVPMLFILGFFFIFVLGGLTGVMVASVPFDLQAHDSHFVVAHLHYVLIGGMVFPLIAAFYYWTPHFTGRMMSERLGRWAFWLMFAGFNLTFLMMHLTGLRGMPRRIATYPEGIGWDRLNLLSTLGSYVLAAGVLVFVVDFIAHRWRGPVAPRDPWGAGTLEWLYPPIAPTFNFRAIPQVRGREPLWDDPALLTGDPDRLDGWLRDAPRGERETMGVHPVTGAPLEILRLPNNTFTPVVAAFGIAVAATATIFGAYLVALGGLALMLAGFAAWGWERSASGEARPDGRGGHLPVHAADPRGHSHVATVATLVLQGALFASLVFGVLFLWNVQPLNARITARPEGALAALAGLNGVIVAALAVAAQRWGGVVFDLLVAVGAALSALALIAALAPVDPWGSALGATGWALGVFMALQWAVVLWWSVMLAALRLGGKLRPGQGVADLTRGTYATGAALMGAGTAALFLLGPGA